jgi:hypothetical protein
MGLNPLPYLEKALKDRSERKPAPSILNQGKPVAPKYLELAKEEAK